MAASVLMERQLRQAVEDFKAEAGLNQEELQSFAISRFEDVERTISAIQQQQAKSRKLMYMRRLEPFLKTMAEYGKVIDTFVNASTLLAFIWGPMKLVIMISSTLPAAFSGLLKMYEHIGEQIPLLSLYKELFANNSHMRDVLVLIFKDILAFHLEAFRYFKQKVWKQLFISTWKGFESKFNDLQQNFKRHCQLIESRASLVEYQQIQNFQQANEAKLNEIHQQSLSRRRANILRWLSPADTEAIHERHAKARSGNSAAGQWLVEDHRFQKWFDPMYCSSPLIWLNGSPGTGKTVLASVIVEKARQIAGISIVFFYCSDHDPTRNNFISIARGLLAQLVTEHPTLIALLDNEMSTKSGEAVLSSSETAKRLLRIALRMKKTYIIIDGIDECSRDERKEICSWFCQVVDSLPRIDMDQIRCLFISQDDGIGRKDLGNIPTISVTSENNRLDIKTYANSWQVHIEQKFGKFGEELNITEVVTSKAQGMFIFARCALEELYQQPSRNDLLAEWRAEMFPTELNELYDRIITRVLHKTPQSRQRVTLRLLSWIACAKRPLRWQEIQAAITIDLDAQSINDENKRLIHNAKDFCASLVSVRPDQIVELVHPTLREYLLQKELVNLPKVERELCILSVAYLCFPAINRETLGSQLDEAIKTGVFAFYDYAIVNWVRHLLSWLPHSKEREIREIGDDLEAMLDLHYTGSSIDLHPIPKRMQDTLKPLEILDIYDSLSHIIIWTRKSLLADKLQDQTPSLDFPIITTNFRSALEQLSSINASPSSHNELETYYGCTIFKCPKLYCEYFHKGFEKLEDRDKHVARHDRAFMCSVEGCPITTIGCANERDLTKHMREVHQVYASGDFPEAPKENAKPRRDPTNHSRFQCNLCQKTFTRSHTLKVHVRTHTNVRPFVCAICDKAFLRQHDKKRHEKLHELRDFVCGGGLNGGRSWGCGLRFPSADVMKDHFRSEAGRICIRALLEEDPTQKTLLDQYHALAEAESTPGPPPESQMPTTLLEQYRALAEEELGPRLPPDFQSASGGANGHNEWWANYENDAISWE